MGNEQRMDQFVQGLPHNHLTPTLLRPKDQRNPLQLQVQRPSPYVWPEIEFESESNKSPIFLLKAPAAMGKTVAAQAIAHALKAPLVSVAEVAVGANALTGLLTNELGWDQAPQLISEIQQGRASIVLDGLDEAQLRSGREHFQAFIEDIAQTLRGASAYTQVLLLGRPETIETTDLMLQEFNVEPAVGSIAPLGRKNSADLIYQLLDHKNRTTHKEHYRPFAELRDTLFNQIGQALTGDTDWSIERWGEAAHFIGYPPVLMVLADWLAVDNPMSTLQNVKADKFGRGDGFYAQNFHGDLLLKVVKQILEREQQKVATRLGGELADLRQDQAEQILYTPSEQCLRILQLFDKRSRLQNLGPESLSPSDRRQYEDRIKDFVPEHPFMRGHYIANVVFEDYLQAYLATLPVGEAQGVEATNLLSAFPESGPFFVHFVHALSRTAVETSPGSQGTGYAREDLLDRLRRSYARGSDVPTEVRYRHLNGQASLQLRRKSDDANARLDLNFEVIDPAGIVEFTTPLARAEIISDSMVALAAPHRQIELGPDVLVFAQTLGLHGNQLAAWMQKSKVGAVLVAAQAEHSPELTVKAYPLEALRVSWTDMWYQFRDYRFELPSLDDRLNGPRLYTLMFGIRRVLLSFTSSASGDPSLYWEKLERQVLNGNPIYEAGFRGLKTLGVIERVGDIYYLRLTRLQDFHANYEFVRRSDFLSVLEPLRQALLEIPEVRDAVRSRS